MKPAAIAGAVLSCCGATAALEPAALVPAPAPPRDHRIPTSYESAVLGRRILALTPLGTLSTVFPEDKRPNDNNDASAQGTLPSGLGGMPYGLTGYIADCEGNGLGNPTILGVTVSMTFKNAAAGSNVSLAVQWLPPHPPAKRVESRTRSSWLSFFGLGSGGEAEGEEEDEEQQQQSHQHRHHHDIALPYSAANLPRFSLLGHLERIEGGDDRTAPAGSKLARCFVKTHPDARRWLPGRGVLESHFVRLVVERIYWVGGFGDRAFIGWIPVEEWHNVTRAEWQRVRLPGEKKGWKEWSSAQVDL